MHNMKWLDQKLARNTLIEHTTHTVHFATFKILQTGCQDDFSQFIFPKLSRLLLKIATHHWMCAIIFFIACLQDL